MEENKKKLPEEDEQKAPEASSEENQSEPKPDEKSCESKQDDEKQEEQPKDDSKTENADDDKDEEILRLKTQISAMQSGIKPDCVEDAVAIAESYIRTGKSTDISSALSEVVKKYPDMKSDGKDNKKQGGFKIGAETPDKGNQDESRLDNAFGIRKKK